MKLPVKRQNGGVYTLQDRIRANRAEAANIPEHRISMGAALTGVFSFLLLSLLLFPAGLAAQEFRATISGTVADPTGAVVPGATVQVRETSTGTINRTVSDAAGQYVVPFLLPGNYTITVTAKGFESFTRTGITLQAQDHPIIDLALQVGSASLTVTVNSAAPLLDTANASVNTVISTGSVADLPLNGRAPSTFAELSAGVITTAAPELVHPFDNNAGNSWSIGGTPNQVSEVLLDGSPDETLLGALAFSPSQDSVQEVSVQPFATDASLGHTIGGVVNQITKSGTNRLHGTMYEFGQISGIDANTFTDSPYWNSGKEKPTPVAHFNQYGLTAGGPVWIPKVFNGQNKLFFFFAWEGLKDSTPTNTLLTVPTTTSVGGSPGTGGEVNGDFYQILAAGCPNGFSSNTASTGAYCNIDSSHTAPYLDPYQIFDPRTGSGTSTITRTPIFNNQIGTAKNGLNAVGQAYVKLFPAPNATGNSFGADNYNSPAPSLDNYNNEFGRLDYNVRDNDHLFLDVRHNIRGQIKNNYFGNNTTGTTLTRENWGTELDNVYTLNPTTVLDVRLNWMLFYEAHGTPAQIYSPSTVGITAPSTTNEVELPYASFTGASSCSNGGTFACLGDTGSSLDPSTSYQIFADVTKVIGRHTLKVGFDGRQYRLSVTTYGDASGAFTFNSSYTNPSSASSTTEMGLDLAALMLGVPSSGEYDVNARADYHQDYVGSFIQDDWRVSNKLTLNLGVRYDINTPFEERLGRTVNGFNPTAAVTYAKTVSWTPTTETVNGQGFTVSSINLNGGLTFPNQNNGAVFATNSGFFSPRAGLSYSLDNKTVLRGGVGIFVQPETMSSEAATGVTSSNALSNQEGYSASTSYVTSTNSGLTITGSMATPFPTLAAAVGSSQGASTFLGSPAAINFLAPSQHDPYSERWNLGVQRQLTSHLMAEVLYVGNHAVHLPVGTQNINAMEKQYLSTTPYFNYNLNKAYSTKITNPFLAALGTTNTTGLNTSSTESFSNFTVPFPQYGTTAITEQNETEGQSYFHSGIIHVEERASKGLTLTANYSFSKMIEADSYLNDVDTSLTRRISPFDHTHHFTVGGTYELPFGQGKMFSLGGKRLWDEIAGGYVINGIYQFQTGAPIYLSADIPLAPTTTSLRQISNQPRLASLTVPALSTTAFVTTTAPSSCSATCDGSVNIGGQYVDHYRTLPQTLSWVRQDGYNNLDASILKDFHFTEGSYFQLRFETFNTLNHPIFAAPTVSSGSSSTFGTITAVTANSLPRQIQIGGRIVF
jgi:hypothetical protein